MKERIFNIFLFVSSDVVNLLGAVCHERDGTDAEKMKFLQDLSTKEYRDCKRYELPESVVLMRDGRATRRQVTYETFKQLHRTGAFMHVLEPIFEDMSAPRNPLMVITPIVDGKPCIEAISDLHGNIHGSLS